MSSSLPASFKPTGLYPFLDHTKSTRPEPPSPSKYARGVAYSQNPPSPPSTQPPTPPLAVVAPTPQYAPSQMAPTRSTSSASSISSSSSVSSVEPIFTKFSFDERVIPELEEVVKKKKSAWSKK